MNSAPVTVTPSAPSGVAAPTNLSIAAGPKKLTLTWTQSTTAGVTNNKIYRSNTSGGPYALQTTIAPTTGWTQTGLTSGTTYYYVVTAVASAGESPNSNQALGVAK